MEVTACFVSASNQNVFFAEMLDAFAEALAAVGVRVERSVDCFPQLRDGLVYIFVPHELLPLTVPEAHPTRSQLRSSIAICTEQPGTHWFEEDAKVAESAALAVDINRLGVHALRKRGVDARLLQLGYVPAWDHWKGQEGQGRPVELTFQGAATPRRLHALARCASRLAGRRTELHLSESALPHQADSPAFLSGARKWEILRSSRLMLNIHRSELGYLEWQRAIGAIVNGCVVVSEHSLGFEPLVPGEHFISVSYRSVEFAVGALLEEPERVAAIRRTAYSLLRDELPMSKSVTVLAEAVAEIGGQALTRPDRRLTAVLPRPKPPRRPSFEYERILEERSDVDIVRMAVKQMLLEQRRLTEHVKQMRAGVRDEELEAFEVESFGPPAVEPVMVSVLLSVYNYASLVRRAIGSVAESDFDAYELIVVDDASSDGSAEAIRDALAAAPWVQAKVLTRAHNRGLSRAATSPPTLRRESFCSSSTPTTACIRMRSGAWRRRSRKIRRRPSPTGSSSGSGRRARWG